MCSRDRLQGSMQNNDTFMGFGDDLRQFFTSRQQINKKKKTSMLLLTKKKGGGVRVISSRKIETQNEVRGKTEASP